MECQSFLILIYFPLIFLYINSIHLFSKYALLAHLYHFIAHLMVIVSSQSFHACLFLIKMLSVFSGQQSPPHWESNMRAKNRERKHQPLGFHHKWRRKKTVGFWWCYPNWASLSLFLRGLFSWPCKAFLFLFNYHPRFLNPFSLWFLFLSWPNLPPYHFLSIPPELYFIMLDHIYKMYILSVSCNL